ncbi:hypothetical protein BH11BAC2_BH11BAC2_11090 [soil metagenome]
MFEIASEANNGFLNEKCPLRSIAFWFAVREGLHQQADVIPCGGRLQSNKNWLYKNTPHKHSGEGLHQQADVIPCGRGYKATNTG